MNFQQQSSSSSSNRFIEHDVSTTRKLGPSSGIRENELFIINQNNALIYADFLFGKLPATDGYMKKGQKTQKNLNSE